MADRNMLFLDDSVLVRLLSEIRRQKVLAMDDVNQPSYSLLGSPFDPSIDIVRTLLPSVHLENWRWSDLDPRCHAARLFSYCPALQWHHYHRCEIFSVASAYMVILLVRTPEQHNNDF